MSTRARVQPAGAINTAAAIVVLLVVAVLAFRAASSAPPAVAEFAPQAQQIRAAPPEQTSAVGSAPGGASSASRPSASPSLAKSGSAILRHCVGDPPRQIEDPQSPPCVPYWSGDNGGGPSIGVDAKHVEVVWVYQGSNPNGSTTLEGEAAALQNFFNQRFEFYGRQVVLQKVVESDGSTTGQQALANQVVQQYRPFASTEHTDQGGLQYHEELARRHVVSTFGFEANPSESDLQAYAPYLWSYEMGSDNMERTLGSWYCSRLNGRPAVHAGSPALTSRPRKLGILYRPWDYSQNTSMQPIQQALARCGVSPVVVEDSVNNPSNNEVIVQQFSTAGVTSVMCLCYFFYWQVFTASAATQGYFPEWLLSSFGGLDTQWGFHFGQPTPNQEEHAFGLTFQPRQEPLEQDPMWWGWSEGAPGAEPPRTTIDLYQGHLLYRSLLEIMSGIQMAGPRLSPGAFQIGLQHASFPNPDTPIYAGHVGFFGGSHAMTVDAAEWWYDASAPSPYAQEGDGAGAMCYVNHGARHGITDWDPQAPDELFGPSCDSGG